METLFRHILVPIDGSEPSLQAVQMALRIVAACPPCKMTVLYVVDELVLNELVRFSKRSPKEVEAELEEQGRRYLNLARKDAERHGIAISSLTQGRSLRRGSRGSPPVRSRFNHHGAYREARNKPRAHRLGDRARPRLCALPRAGDEVVWRLT